MARRIRWQILIAAASALLVLGLISYLALTTASVARPVAGGAYVEGLTAPPRQLNPLVGDPARDPSGADIQALLFEGLMRIGADGLPEANLAQSVDVNDDGTVYTFALRDGITWHDGQPLGVDDVLFTLRAVQSRSFTGDPLAASVWRDVLIDRAGDRKVRCTLPAPYAPFLSKATFPILPAHLLRDLPPEQWATAPFNIQPVGTGPYQLKELDGAHALLAANPRYHRGRPFLDSIELRFFGDSASALAALTRGEIGGIGFAGGDLSRATLPRTITRHTTPLDSYTVLTFNLRQGPLADQGLRRALALGLDKDALISGPLGGQAARLDTPILPGWWAASTEPPRAADPQQAAGLLDSLGYAAAPDGSRARDGVPLTLALITDDAPDRAAAAAEIARQWGALGVKVAVQPLDSDTLRARLAAHEFTLALHGWQRLGADPDVLELWHSRGADGGLNYAGLKDAEIDRLLTDAHVSDDLNARQADYIAFQRRWAELAPSITLYQPLYTYAATAQLGGLSVEQAPGAPATIASDRLLLGHEDRFRNVTRWFIRSAREIRGELRAAP